MLDGSWLMAQGSWLKSHGSWPREARGGSWLMARGRPSPGDPEARGAGPDSIGEALAAKVAVADSAFDCNF